MEWLLHDGFRNLLRQAWKNSFHGSAAYQLARKIELLKKEIKKWRKANSNNEFQMIDRANLIWLLCKNVLCPTGVMSRLGDGLTTLGHRWKGVL